MGKTHILFKTKQKQKTMKQKRTNGQIVILGLFIVFLIIWAFFVADIRQQQDAIETQDTSIVNFRNQTH